ncbi:ESX secretion-associated protein EspG [Nocardia harenae]|uniref:ESX secretion-associated protein EspG n=1 Tax=Nocardia harenae TaxID=358707 RepID=UPI00082B2BF8|nr:ESX secretion-associated protein EspG [Nocardia harenae]
MTEVGWNLSDIEFKVLCDEYRKGHLPAPFNFVSRVSSAALYEAECARLRELVRTTTTSEFTAMTEALARPEAFVVMRSWHDTYFDDPLRHIRLHAVLRGDRAYLMRQHPGETLTHSSGFDIVRQDRASVVGALVAHFPSVGRGSGDGIPAARNAASPYLELPATATGFVKVLAGAPGPDGNRSEVGLLWRDIVGDGRYALPLHYDAPAAVPMGAAELADWTTERIAEVLPAL